MLQAAHGRLRGLRAHLAPAVTAATEPELEHGAELLSAEEIERFHELGYLALPGIVSEEHIAAIADDFDEYAAKERGGGPRLQQPSQSPVLGALASYAPVVERVKLLMAANCEGDGLPSFSLHHQHALLSRPGDGGSNWHQVSIPKPDRYLPTELTPRTTCTRVCAGLRAAAPD